ncbi:MAG: DinB family protein [Gemmatimonadales bacterium]
MRRKFDKFLALANAIPADKYSWRPMPGVRSFGEVFMHLASEFYVYTPLSFGAAPSPVIPRVPDAMKTSRRTPARTACSSI